MAKEKVFEINGNLDCILNYKNFESVIVCVRNRFIELFGEDIMTRIPVYVDNATAMGGYTPIITPILGKYLCIKLNIANFLNTEQIIYQFVHEFCHYVFYSIKGLDKPFADEYEESVCTAMSLCILKDCGVDVEHCNGDYESWVEYVLKLENKGYRNGAAIAESVNYKSSNLAQLILKKAGCE